MSRIFTDEEGNKYEFLREHGGRAGELVIKPVPAEPPYWRPNDREQFWFVNAAGNVLTDTMPSSYITSEFHKIGNLYATEEQAELAAKCVRALFVWLADRKPDNWTVVHQTTDEYKLFMKRERQ